MLDETDHQNRAVVGEFWETAEWQVIRGLVSTLPHDEQNVEGVFNALSSRAFLGKKVAEKSEMPVSYLPFGIAFDREGNLYIADTFNNRIRRVVRNW